MAWLCGSPTRLATSSRVSRDSQPWSFCASFSDGRSAVFLLGYLATSSLIADFVASDTMRLHMLRLPRLVNPRGSWHTPPMLPLAMLLLAAAPSPPPPRVLVLETRGDAAYFEKV